MLFQFFNVFNARNENESAFNPPFLENRALWVSLAGTLILQALAVHWTPASQLFGTTGMTVYEWGVAVGVASSVLLLEEARRFASRSYLARHQVG